jgi:hypothetical protein
MKWVARYLTYLITMGQRLPLPKRVPFPARGDVEKTIAMGIVLSGVNAEGYAKMTLPNGWKFVDDSCDWTMPDWVIVDSSGLERARIIGICGYCMQPWARFVVHETPRAYVPSKKA